MRPTSILFSLLLSAAAVRGAKQHDKGPIVAKSFTWKLPFQPDGSPPMGMEVPCSVSATFRATQYRLGDLQAPSEWSDPVLTYLGWHPYPGSWDGIDAGGDERDLIIMEYVDVPVAVRDWVDAQHRDRESDKSRYWLFGVFAKAKKDLGKADGVASAAKTPVPVGDDAAVIPDEDKVLIFAPGALYDILPLWVARDGGCEADMLDLSKYSSYARDKSVIAWPIEHETSNAKNGRQDLTFRIQAHYVLETDDGKNWRKMWERLQVQLQRQARKEEREKRQSARGNVKRAKDEL